MNKLDNLISKTLLIDKIIEGCEHDGSYIPVTEVKRLMQSYHEAKLKEIAKQWGNDGDEFICIPDVTPADIEAWVEKKFSDVSMNALAKRVGAFIGAKAALNGEIKHIK